MKTTLRLQLILAIILAACSAASAVDAFVRDSVLIWKGFTVIMTTLFVIVIRINQKELKEELKNDN